MNTRRLTLALFLMLAMAASVRGDEWPVAVGESTEPNPYKYEAAQWESVPPAIRNGASVCTLYFGETVTWAEDGTVERTMHWVYRVNDANGLKSHGRYKHLFHPNGPAVVLNLARVHKADGEVVPLTPRDVLIRDNTDDQPDVFHDTRYVYFFFRGLAVGDVVELKLSRKWTASTINGILPGKVEVDTTAKAIVRYVVRVPKGRQLKAAWDDAFTSETVEDEKETTRVWNARNLPARDTKTAQQANVRYSSRTWEEVAASYREDLQSHCSPEAAELAAELTAGLTTDEQKAKQIAGWIRQNIRYTSVGHRSGYEPLAPAEVIARRFGDCKDVAHLFVEMLREVGVVAEHVLVHVDNDVLHHPNVPLAWFDHMIAVVRLDGQDHWIDLTSNGVTEWDVLAPSVGDRFCLVIEDNGYRLSRTPRNASASSVVPATPQQPGNTLPQPTVQPDTVSVPEQSRNVTPAVLALLTLGAVFGWWVRGRFARLMSLPLGRPTKPVAEPAVGSEQQPQTLSAEPQFERPSRIEDRDSHPELAG